MIDDLDLDSGDGGGHGSGTSVLDTTTSDPTGVYHGSEWSDDPSSTPDGSTDHATDTDDRHDTDHPDDRSHGGTHSDDDVLAEHPDHGGGSLGGLAAPGHPDLLGDPTDDVRHAGGGGGGAGGSGLPLGGVDPTRMAATNPLWKEPADTLVKLNSPTMVGHPIEDANYLLWQGTGNAFCGPYSSAMVLNALTNGKGPTGQEMVDKAVGMGILTQDPSKVSNSWGGWGGITDVDLDRMLDDQLAGTGGSSEIYSPNTLDDLENALKADHRIIAFVDSAELDDPSLDEGIGVDGIENHYVVVTGIDRVNGWVMLNDPYKQKPSLMPLAQFHGAWSDSKCTMIEVSAPAQTGPVPPVPTTGPAPLVSLPSTLTNPPTTPGTTLPGTTPPGPGSLGPAATGSPLLPATPGPAVGAPPVPGLPTPGSAPASVPTHGSAASHSGTGSHGSGGTHHGHGSSHGGSWSGGTSHASTSLGAVVAPAGAAAGIHAAGSAEADSDWDWLTVLPMTLQILAAAPMALVDGVVTGDPAAVARTVGH